MLPAAGRRGGRAAWRLPRVRLFRQRTAASGAALHRFVERNLPGALPGQRPLLSEPCLTCCSTLALSGSLAPETRNRGRLEQCSVLACPVQPWWF
jgi:hypothetical protein